MRQLKIAKHITSRDSRSLNSYLNEISQMRLLKPEEEVELTKRMKNGDQIAMRRIIEANLRFVVSVAKQYVGQGLPLADLINEGNVGLIKAARKFDDTRGFRFISYAVWWIRQSILQALADNSRLIRIPMNQVLVLQKIHKAGQQLEQLFEREPNENELADSLAMAQEDVKELLSAMSKPLSIDEPLCEDDDQTLLDKLSNEDSPRPDQSLITDSLRIEITRTLQMLNTREQYVLTHLFGLSGTRELSLEEISEELEISRERVRQLKEQALQKIRRSRRQDKLKTFVA